MLTQEEQKRFHRAARNKAVRKHYWANKEYHQERQIKRKYGVDLEEYEELLKKQSGTCAICNAAEPKGRGVLFHIDHDHTTGRIRGLLCNRCNLGLGSFGDDPELLRKALAYLEPEEVALESNSQYKGEYHAI